LGGVSDEKVKYSYGSCTTWTNDCTANYTPVLSSEKVPHFNNQAVVRVKKRRGKIWS
jgi:hypothetical protein